MKEDQILDKVEKIFKSMEIAPEKIEIINKALKDSAKNERDYYKKHMKELSNEARDIKLKLDKLTDLLIENKIDEESYNSRRAKFISRREAINKEIRLYGKADDNFNETLIKMLKT